MCLLLRLTVNIVTTFFYKYQLYAEYEKHSILLWRFSDRASWYRLFQITNLMYNSFIFQQYVCYTTILNMFRAARCSSSGGTIVSPQPLVSSPSVYSRTVCSWRVRTAVRSPPAYCMAAYRGWRYQRLWWYNWSSWGWAACCSKHVEDRSVTYILLKNKRIVH